MAMVTVEIRPGLTVRLNEKEAARRGLTPIDPKNNKKAEPTATKKRKKKTTVEAPPTEESTNGICNDD